MKKQIDYLIRAIPVPLWKKFKAKAGAERRNLRTVLLELIKQYVEKP